MIMPRYAWRRLMCAVGSAVVRMVIKTCNVILPVQLLSWLQRNSSVAPLATQLLLAAQLMTDAMYDKAVLVADTYSLYCSLLNIRKRRTAPTCSQ
jgi:hypothetical protein